MDESNPKSHKILTLISSEIVGRFWDSINDALERVLEARNAEDSQAKSIMTAAILALALGPERSQVLLDRVCAQFIDSNPDVASMVIQYDKIRSDWPNLAWEDIKYKYCLPPLKYPHELIAIDVMDRLGTAKTFEHDKRTYYNLLHVGILGGVILSAATQAREVFLRMHP